MFPPGSIRPVEFGTCAGVTCQRDAEYEVLHVNEETSLWVPLCVEHLNSGPIDGLEYIIQVHGFVPAGAGLT